MLASSCSDYARDRSVIGTYMAEIASSTVHEASTRNSHRHEAIPKKSWKKYSIVAVTRPPKAPDRRLPEYRIEVRKASSFLVYHDDRRNKAPGKKGLITH